MFACVLCRRRQQQHRSKTTAVVVVFLKIEKDQQYPIDTNTILIK
jgi:hypothetical protein